MQELEPLVLAALVELHSDEFALGWLLDIVRDACPDAEFDEPPRVPWRLHSLRGWSDGTIPQVSG